MKPASLSKVVLGIAVACIGMAAWSARSAAQQPLGPAAGEDVVFAGAQVLGALGTFPFDHDINGLLPLLGLLRVHVVIVLECHVSTS